MFFHALIFSGSRGSCLNMRPKDRVFKLLPRDPANVNALKQTCVIVILAFYIHSKLGNSRKSRLKNHENSRFDCSEYIVLFDVVPRERK